MFSKLVLFCCGIFLCSNIDAVAVSDGACSVDTISTMGDTCYAVKIDGSLWSWGAYDDANLGNGTGLRSGEPQQILNDVRSVNGCYAVKKDGSLWGWGSAIEVKGSLAPVHIMDSVQAVTRANGYTLYIKDDMSLWGSGCNYEGALGQKELSKDNSEAFKIMNNAVEAACGYDHTVVLKTDGSVITFGDNTYGQLGNGTKESTYRKNHIMDKVKYINAGVSSTFAIDDDNNLWRCGTNYGLGYGAGEASDHRTAPDLYLEGVKDVNSQVGYNLVLLMNGELWMYGCDEGEERTYTSGDGTVLYIDLPVKLMDDVVDISNTKNGISGPVLILTKEGELYQYDMVEAEPYVGEWRIKKVMDGVRVPKSSVREYETEYTDISELSDNVRSSIEHLGMAGVMSGITETEFMPEKYISRAEMAAVLLRMTGKANLTGTASFADVDETDWYYNIAAVSQSSGIMNGYEDNTFRGDATVSEYELVALAARALRNEGTAVEPDKYIDMMPGHVPDWAETDIRYAIDHGIISEDEAAGLSDETMSRGDAAVILYRLYELI